jgi:hypothetical protein
MIRITAQKFATNLEDSTEFFDKILPLPQKLEPQSGSIVLDENVKFMIEGFSEAPNSFPKLVDGINFEYLIDPIWSLGQFAEKCKEWLNARIAELGIKLEFQSNQFSTRGGIKTESEHDSSKKTAENQIAPKYRREGYLITANETAFELIAWTMRGAYYGIRTITQMLTTSKKARTPMVMFPACKIIDYPLYAMRGLVDDISRGQRPTLENFKKFIRFLSCTKQNALVLYIEDIYKWESHPRIGQGRGPLTKADIKELEAYAKDWFVNIIPGVEMLGHMDNILSDPFYREYAEFPGAQCLNVSNPKTKVFVDELLREIVPVFESPVFAPICDESFDFGKGASRQYVKERGFARAMADWYLFLIETIKKYGKQAVLFAHDIIAKHDEALQAIRGKDTLIYYWNYSNRKKYPAISKIVKKGFAVAGGPGVFDWSRHFPYFDYAEVNMIEMGKDGLQRGLIGLVTTKWGDFFNENFRDNIFYGLAVNGQAAWSPFQSHVPKIRKAYAWIFHTTLDDTVIECLNILSQQNKVLPSFPNGLMNRFWMDPFVREISPKELAYAERFISEGITVLNKLAGMQSKKIILTNTDNLDYIHFAARMARHYGAKILLSEAVYRRNPQFATVTQKHLGYPGDAIQQGFGWLRSDIEQLAKDYEKLWLRLAVREGLEYPMAHFQVLQWYYDRILEDFAQSIQPHTRQLSSHWIWRTGKRNSASWGNHQWFYFAKPFICEKPIKRAIVQAIAGDHLNVYLNGQFIGEVLSRFSLSSYPMGKAVQWFDVTSKLQNNHTNLLLVEGINHSGGIGGINVILHIDYADATFLDIISDDTWIYAEKKPEGWPDLTQEMLQTPSFSPVQSFGPPPGAWFGPISAPDWDRNQKSSITFGFGNKNFFECSISSFVPERLHEMLYWLVPRGVKWAKVDLFGFRLELPDGTTKIVP